MIGHVERAWDCSIQPPGIGPQLVPFRNCIGRILLGQPVGHSTRDFSEKYAVLSGDLLQKLDQTQAVRRLPTRDSPVPGSSGATLRTTSSSVTRP